VTGGCGFVGSNLAIRLVELGADVLVVDSMIPDYGGNEQNLEPVRSRLRIDPTDVRETGAMAKLLPDQEIIFNLAGQVSHIDSMRDPETDLEINSRAQLRLLDACRSANPDARVVFASTRQIYGRPQYLPVDERHPIRPTDVNGVNKLAGELYHQLYNDAFGLRTCCLRFTNIFGPRQLVRTDRQTFIGWFIHQILDDQTIEIFGDGSQLRDFTYVDDAVDVLLRAGAMDAAVGDVFNVGGTRPYSLLEVVRLMTSVANSGRYVVVPFPEGRRRIDIGSFYTDDTKVRRVLGWEPVVSFEEGLSRTFEYFRANREHYW
jgi:UDP-glucose 4-epimerase